LRQKVDVTVGTNTCPLCGRRALADFGDEGIVCGGCDSAFESDLATGRIRYTRVSAAYRPLESRLSGSWLTRAEVVEVGRTLTLGRARWLVIVSAGAIAAIALFTCALGGAFALAPGIRDSQARIAQANASITSTLTLTPTTAATATFGPAPGATGALGTPTRSPSPTAPGPLNSPLPTPSRASDLPNPTATRAQPSTGTPSRPAAVPTQGPTEALPTFVLPPTFTPVVALPSPATTLTPTATAIAPAETVTVAIEVLTATASPEPGLQDTATSTPTAAPAVATPTVTPTPTATSSIGKSLYFGVVVIRSVKYLGTPALDETDEYVELENTGGTFVAVQGWSIRHRQGSSVVVIPALTLLPGQICRIFTAPQASGESCGPISFGNYQNLWPNDSDTLQLLDLSSLLADEYAYPP